MINSTEDIIIDSDFLKKIVHVTDGIDIFHRIIKEYGKRPVIHEYVAYRELDTDSLATSLITTNSISVIKTQDYLKDAFVPLYTETFKSHYKFMNHKELSLPPKCDIFTYRHAEENLGEIHSCLMAQYTKTPFFMSDDRQAKDLAMLRVNSDRFTLTVISVLDVLAELAKKKANCITETEALLICKANYKKDQTREVKRLFSSNES